MIIARNPNNGNLISAPQSLFDVLIECMFQKMRYIQLEGVDEITGFRLEGTYSVKRLWTALPLIPYFATANPIE